LKQVVIDELLLHLVLQEGFDDGIEVLSVTSPKIQIEFVTHILRVVPVLFIGSECCPLFDE
jgi:hypothetical protein